MRSKVRKLDVREIDKRWELEPSGVKRELARVYLVTCRETGRAGEVVHLFPGEASEVFYPAHAPTAGHRTLYGAAEKLFA